MADDRIPLFCSICPKRPTFSDTSHLLTHIGSKGHLSNYYRGKIRSAHDSHTRQMIDEYDTWYNEWGLEDLMCERISLKDKKKLRSEATSALNAPTTRLSSTRVLQNRPVNRQISGLLTGRRSNLSTRLTHSGQLNSVSLPYPTVDPDLYAQSVKEESLYNPSLSNEDSPRLPSSNEGPWRRQISTRYGSSLTLRTPPARGLVRAQNGSPLFVNTRTSAHEPTVTDRDNTEEPAEDEYDDGIAKLKGVLWPGMSIFDSATAIARRRRNQKKDDSVIVRLKENSEQVDCTEIVYNPDWSLNKERFIDGLPSSSPPPESPRLLPLMPHENTNFSMDVDTAIQLNPGSTASAEQNVRFPMDSVVATPYGHGRYNLRNEICSDPRDTYSPNDILLEKNKNTLDIYRDEKSGTSLIKPTRISMLTRGLDNDNDDEYIPREQRVQRRRLNGKRRSRRQLSFGDRLIQHAQLNEDFTGNGDDSGMAKTASSPMHTGEDLVHHTMMHHPFNYELSPSYASSFDHGTMFPGATSSMNLHNSYGSIPVMHRNQSVLAMDNFGGGSLGMPFAGQTVHHHQGVGFGQYPGRNFGYGFGMHAMPVGFNHEHLSHGSQTDPAFLQLGIFNGGQPIAPELWSTSAQDDQFDKINVTASHLACENHNVFHKRSESRNGLDEEFDLSSPKRPSSPINHPDCPSTTPDIVDEDFVKTESMPIDGAQATTSAVAASTEYETRLATSTERIPAFGRDEETDDEKKVSEINSTIRF